MNFYHELKLINIIFSLALQFVYVCIVNSLSGGIVI